MKEISFKGYVRSYGVRAIGEDIHIIRALYDEVHDDSGSIFSECECEVTVRIIDRRQDWIDQRYREAMDMVNSTDCYGNGNLAHLKFCKDATIFIRHWLSADDDVGVAAPRHGDKYDRETGIAVAYAKAMGEMVPDYI